EGFEVTLLEREHFPRCHIGESMLPRDSIYLCYVDQLDPNYTFNLLYPRLKYAWRVNRLKTTHDTDFINPDPNRAAWNVTRAEFDEILLRNASENSVRVFEGASVTAINFSPENDKQPVSAQWKSGTGATGEVQFKWLVYASGRNGIMSTKYLKNRKFNTSLRNVAWWGYWTGANKYTPGTSRENAPWIDALTDESGWVWFIPLHDGRVSVGFLLKEDLSRAKKAEVSGPDTTETHYSNRVQFVPGLRQLLGDAKFLGEVGSAADYSFSAAQYAGPNYRIAGDAGGRFRSFEDIDPCLAFGGALSASCTIAAIRGQCMEEEAIRFHNEKTGTSYTRFLIVVLSGYKQITAQSDPVLSDIDEGNFDRAFHFIRPVIQGTADIDPGVTEQMDQDAMEFCASALD
ncbi:hypothetical protein FB451DRAFT_1523706, partial [Mycena latifolia]